MSKKAGHGQEEADEENKEDAGPSKRKARKGAKPKKGSSETKPHKRVKSKSSSADTKSRKASTSKHRKHKKSSTSSDKLHDERSSECMPAAGSRAYCDYETCDVECPCRRKPCYVPKCGYVPEFRCMAETKEFVDYEEPERCGCYYAACDKCSYYIPKYYHVPKCRCNAEAGIQKYVTYIDDCPCYTRNCQATGSGIQANMTRSSIGSTKDIEAKLQLSEVKFEISITKPRQSLVQTSQQDISCGAQANTKSTMSINNIGAKSNVSAVKFNIPRTKSSGFVSEEREKSQEILEILKAKSNKSVAERQGQTETCGCNKVTCLEDCPWKPCYVRKCQDSCTGTCTEHPKRNSYEVETNTNNEMTCQLKKSVSSQKCQCNYVTCNDECPWKPCYVPKCLTTCGGVQSNATEHSGKSSSHLEAFYPKKAVGESQTEVFAVFAERPISKAVLYENRPCRKCHGDRPSSSMSQFTMTYVPCITVYDKTTTTSNSKEQSKEKAMAYKAQSKEQLDKFVQYSPSLGVMASKEIAKEYYDAEGQTEESDNEDLCSPSERFVPSKQVSKEFYLPGESDERFNKLVKYEDFFSRSSISRNPSGGFVASKVFTKESCDAEAQTEESNDHFKVVDFVASKHNLSRNLSEQGAEGSSTFRNPSGGFVATKEYYYAEAQAEENNDQFKVASKHNLSRNHSEQRTDNKMVLKDFMGQTEEHFAGDKVRRSLNVSFLDRIEVLQEHYDAGGQTEDQEEFLNFVKSPNAFKSKKLFSRK